MADEQQDHGRRDTARLVGIVVLVVLVVAFVLDNRHSVRIGVVFFDRRFPLIWVLLVTLLLGAVIDRLVTWRRSR